MKPEAWLGDDVDERLRGLFSEDPTQLRNAITDTIERAGVEPDLEEILIETLEVALDEGNDASMGSTWIAVILGEMRSWESTRVLIKAFGSEDETLVAAAVRALRRIGEPAFEGILEILEEGDLPDEITLPAVETLEGVSLHDLPETRERAETRLVRDLVDRARSVPHREAAALTLARLGVERAREPLERILKQEFEGGNAYLQDALEILTEQPRGLPCSSDGSWESDLGWAPGDGLPAGSLEAPED